MFAKMRLGLLVACAGTAPALAVADELSLTEHTPIQYKTMNDTQPWRH